MTPPDLPDFTRISLIEASPHQNGVRHWRSAGNRGNARTVQNAFAGLERCTLVDHQCLVCEIVRLLVERLCPPIDEQSALWHLEHDWAGTRPRAREVCAEVVSDQVLDRFARNLIGPGDSLEQPEMRTVRE